MVCSGKRVGRTACDNILKDQQNIFAVYSSIETTTKIMIIKELDAHKTDQMPRFSLVVMFSDTCTDPKTRTEVNSSTQKRTRNRRSTAFAPNWMTSGCSITQILRNNQTNAK
ncbi:hypothetical protein CHS0354_004506 [Potamilus streckersoni]|uniref:Uncharacterized protein n=1 Tax=Potamilus streckersoni TaxID=2493646 RepID=A0AAE0S5I4_9BIVA|nr:hypothetical protein CHS0354_004506 [Potamilus streckersoni]